MPDLLTGADFGQVLAGFERTARRLETRDRYASPAEDEVVRRFLAGEPLGPAFLQVWLDQVRDATAAGKRVERVRVVSEPLSDYKRAEMVICRYNVEAGEDISYLKRGTATALDLPDYDYWLFDSARLALMHFTEEGQFVGAEVVTHPGVVARHQRWFALARQAAVPYWQYLGQDSCWARPPS
jgi:hypothetical protein